MAPSQVHVTNLCRGGVLGGFFIYIESLCTPRAQTGRALSSLIARTRAVMESSVVSFIHMTASIRTSWRPEKSKRNTPRIVVLVNPIISTTTCISHTAPISASCLYTRTHTYKPHTHRHTHRQTQTHTDTHKYTDCNDVQAKLFAVCCSVLQCIAICCRAMQWVAMYRNVLQCVATCSINGVDRVIMFVAGSGR